MYIYIRINKIKIFQLCFVLHLYLIIMRGHRSTHPVTRVLFSSDGATFNSEGATEEDLTDAITYERITDPVIVRGGTEPLQRRTVYDRNGISEWLVRNTTDPLSRYDYGPNHQITSVRDLNPLVERNAFEAEMAIYYDRVPRVPYGQTATEWKNTVVRVLRLEDASNEFLFRESDPANNLYSALKITLPNEIVSNGCDMIEIEFVPENRSFIVSIYEYNLRRDGWVIVHGRMVLNTDGHLFHVCSASMRRSSRLLAEMRRDNLDSYDFFS